MSMWEIDIIWELMSTSEQHAQPRNKLCIKQQNKSKIQISRAFSAFSRDSVAFGSATIRSKRDGQAIGVASRRSIYISLTIFTSLTLKKWWRPVIGELTWVADAESTYGWSIEIALPLSYTHCYLDVNYSPSTIEDLFRKKGV